MKMSTKTKIKFDENHRWLFDINDVNNKTYRQMLAEEAKIIVGYERELLMLNMLFAASGHAVLMANSGLGKTKIANCLPLVVTGLKTARVQGTPDALPSSVIGYAVDTANGERVWRDGQIPGGPDGTHFVLVDEGTRFTPRLWAAFLQLLEERQKTVEDRTQKMPEIFVGVITANFPAPGQGTVELPDAAYDRLMFNLQWGYPTLEGMKEIVRRAGMLRKPDSEKGVIQAVTDVAGILTMRNEVEQLADGASEMVVDYIARLTFGTNPHLNTIEQFKPAGATTKSFKDYVAAGGSPRCGMDLKMAAAALAHALDDDNLRPEHVKAVFPEVARAHTKMAQAASLGKTKVKVDDLITAVLRGTKP
jgi:MoxR-like ATPase